MTDVIIEQDTDWLEMLDFNPAIPCIYMVAENQECQNEAEWRVVLNCCGRVMLLCDEHFNDILEYMAQGYVFVDPPPRGGCGAKDMRQPFASAERLDKSF